MNLHAASLLLVQDPLGTPPSCDLPEGAEPSGAECSPGLKAATPADLSPVFFIQAGVSGWKSQEFISFLTLFESLLCTRHWGKLFRESNFEKMILESNIQ